jgi:hypothetical protein
MMGERLVMQESLFYEFCLEDHVAPDHLLRSLDRFVDCSVLRQHLAGFYSSTNARLSRSPERLLFPMNPFASRIRTRAESTFTLLGNRGVRSARLRLQPGLDGLEQPEAHRAIVACVRDHVRREPERGGCGSHLPDWEQECLPHLDP